MESYLIDIPPASRIIAAPSTSGGFIEKPFKFFLQLTVSSEMLNPAITEDENRKEATIIIEQVSSSHKRKTFGCFSLFFEKLHLVFPMTRIKYEML